MANRAYNAGRYVGYFLLFCLFAYILWVVGNIIALWILIGQYNKATNSNMKLHGKDVSKILLPIR